MSATLDLLRPEISRLKPYKPADYVGGFIRLNANETPWRPPGDESRDGLNRYPDPRPAELTAAPGGALRRTGRTGCWSRAVRAKPSTC